MKWNSGRLWLRVIVYGSLALLLTGLLVQSLIFWQFNEAAVRRSLDGALHDSGRQILIQGTITPHVFPFPGVNLDQVTITEPHGSKPFVRIARVEARLAWWPLLFGQREVRSLALYGADATITRLTNGSLSVADLFTRRQQHGFNINLDHLLIRESKLDYQDQINGSKQRFENINLEANGLKGDADLQAGAVLTDPVRPLRFAINTPLNIENQQIRFDKINAWLVSDATSLGKAQLHMTGQLTLDLANLNAQGQNLVFEFSNERPQLQFTLTVPALRAEPERILMPQSHVSATMQYDRSQYQLEANLNELHIDSQVMNANRLTGVLNWSVGNNRMQLTLDAPFSLSKLNDLAMQPLILKAQAITPLLPRGQLIADLQGSLTGKIDQQRLDLHGTGKIDGSDIALDISQYGFIRPRDEATISIGALDLNRYLPESKGETVAIFQNNNPIPLDWMDFFDLNANVNIGQLSMGRFRMQDVQANIMVNQNKLDLSQMSANIYNGHLQGNIRLERGQVPQLKVQQTLKGMSIRPLLNDLFSFSQLDGNGSGNISVTAQGQSFVDLRNSLTGTVQMRLDQGALSGIDLVAALKNLPAELKEMNTPAHSNQKTTFSNLSASFHFDHGVGRNQDLKLASQLINVNGGGKLNLKQSIIDYNMNVTANPKEFSTLKGINIPLKITGPLNAPVYALNFNAMVRGKKTEYEKQQALKQELQKQITTILP